MFERGLCTSHSRKGTCQPRLLIDIADITPGLSLADNQTTEIFAWFVYDETFYTKCRGHALLGRLDGSLRTLKDSVTPAHRKIRRLDDTLNLLCKAPQSLLPDMDVQIVSVLEHKLLQRRQVQQRFVSF